MSTEEISTPVAATVESKEATPEASKVGETSAPTAATSTVEGGPTEVKTETEAKPEVKEEAPTPASETNTTTGETENAATEKPTENANPSTVTEPAESTEKTAAVPASEEPKNVTETAVVESPVTEPVVTEVPATEAPVTETPAAEAPVTEPVADAPAAEEVIKTEEPSKVESEAVKEDAKPVESVSETSKAESPEKSEPETTPKPVTNVKSEAAVSSEHSNASVDEPADGEEEVDDEEGEAPDDDEDAQNPAYIPRKGAFYMHDSRQGANGAPDDAPTDPRKSRADKKWSHDLFVDHQQKPKSKSELVRKYGFDIRRPDKEGDSNEGTIQAKENEGDHQQRRKNRRDVKSERPTPAAGPAAAAAPPREREQNTQRKEQAGPAPREQKPRIPRATTERGGHSNVHRGGDSNVNRGGAHQQKWRLDDNRKPVPSNTGRREGQNVGGDRGGHSSNHRGGRPTQPHNIGHRQPEQGHNVHFKRTIVSSAYRSNGATNNGPGRHAPAPRPHQGPSDNNNRSGKRYTANTTPLGNGTGGKVFNNADRPQGPPRHVKTNNYNGNPPTQGVPIAPLMAAAPPAAFVPGPGGVPIAVVPVPVATPSGTSYPHPRQPTDVVYFDPNSQAHKTRTPPQPRERRRLEIVPPTQ